MNWKKRKMMLAWLFWFALILVGLVVSYFQGYFGDVIRGDTTGLSIVIGAVFLLGLIWNFRNALRIQKELNSAFVIEASCEEADKFSKNPLNQVYSCVLYDDQSECAEHTRNLMAINARAGYVPDQGNLVESIHARLELTEKYTLYICEALTALGLFGTLIGFMMMVQGGLGNMLNSAGNVESIVQSIKQVLGGIGTALYTTLVGLACALPLLLLHLIVKNGTSELVIKITEIGERYVLPNLPKNMEK